jgi:hypothetical protein
VAKKSSPHIKIREAYEFKKVVEAVKKGKEKKRKKGKLTLHGAVINRPNRSRIKEYVGSKFIQNVGAYLSNCTASHSEDIYHFENPRTHATTSCLLSL